MSEGYDGESPGSANGEPAGAPRAGDKGDRRTDKNKKKPRSNEVGRALRSVYDDTLRESVPGDFMDLLGKLN